MTDQPADVQFGRPFVLIRDTSVIADGIEFPDGHVAIHWTGTTWPTITPHQSMEAATAAHSQDGAVRVVWQLSDIPQAEYSSVWPELVGWVQAAHEDGEQIDPAQLLEYMRELKGRALAPVRQWMAGIRDAARQAAGQTTTEEERYTAEVVQAARRRYDAEPKCPNCGHLWEHHGDEVCGVRGRRQGIAYYCGCTDAEEDHTPAAERREQYGQVLRRWGLLDEVNDPKAAEEFAVTDLLAIVDAERAVVEQPAEAQPAEPPLTPADRQFLTFALELAADQMFSRGDEFEDDDHAALARLRLMAEEQP